MNELINLLCGVQATGEFDAELEAAAAEEVKLVPEGTEVHQNAPANPADASMLFLFDVFAIHCFS